MTGITRRQAAEAAAALFGATARQTHESRTYDPWEVMDREGKAWRFVYDASIRGSRRLGLQQVPTGDVVSGDHDEFGIDHHHHDRGAAGHPP